MSIVIIVHLPPFILLDIANSFLLEGKVGFPDDRSIAENPDHAALELDKM